ncbi:MAG: glucose-1-phosphate thymidylyltransferase RfbA [Sphingobacteriia bacterium]|nr:glucose-1-phosphate thymidylyltransferase RfbA [Sphingobacteriia bacterium]
MKGIILAGGSATRLHPITKVVNKHLLPIYNKPMIYYPLASLMLAGIREVLIISSPDDLEDFKNLFGSGEDYGINISYKIQQRPNGIAESFIIAEDFIGESNVCLILGDNIFYGDNFNVILSKANKAMNEEGKALVFGYHVRDPERYGVIEFDENLNVKSIEEKPKNPKSSYAVVGLYFFPNDVIKIAKTLKPSNRGELEITDVNSNYLKENRLKVEILNKGFAWLDTGTHDSLLQASNFIQTIELRQNLMVGSIEQIAYEKGYITSDKLIQIASKMQNIAYGQNLIKIAQETLI